jgi:hypothetical protein
VKEKGLAQKVLLLGGSVAKTKYAVTSYPASFFIDRQGKVVHREEGFAPFMASSIEDRIRGLLAPPPAPAK